MTAGGATRAEGSSRIPVAVSALLAVAGMAVALLAGVGRAGAHPGPSTAVTILHCLCGDAFVAVGLSAMWLRPRNRVGLLMTAVGFLFFLTDLRYLDSVIPDTVAMFFGQFYFAVLAQLFLSFPDGRLRSARDRIAVAAVYWWVGLSNIGPVVIWAPTVVPQQPVLGLIHDAHAHTVASDVQNVVNIIVVLVVLAIFWDRRAHSSLAARRALAPVWWATGPIVALIVVLNGVNLIASLAPLNAILPLLTPLALMAQPFFFLIGLLRSHLDRAGVRSLLVELGGEAPSARLRDALAVTLHDPSVDVLYWRPDSMSYVDADGRPAELPPPSSGRAVTPLQRDGRPVAALVHDEALAGEPRLVEAVAAAARLAVDNERLTAEVKAQLAEVRASRLRIVEAADAERRRVERDLHDGAQQRLVSLLFDIGALRGSAEASSNSALMRALDRTAEELGLALAEIRELAAGLHPSILTDAGLGPALESLAERAPLPVSVRFGPSTRVTRDVETAAYFVTCEALTNVGKHARAHRATVTVEQSHGHLTVDVSDDGVGGADAAGGSGLRGLMDRVQALGGTLSVDSPAGEGTHIVAVLPCD